MRQNRKQTLFYFYSLIYRHFYTVVPFSADNKLFYCFDHVQRTMSAMRSRRKPQPVNVLCVKIDFLSLHKTKEKILPKSV